MARKLASALMVALIGVPPSASALGLGELDSDSGLNEPLSARIPLLSIRDNDAASIHISLAPPDAFERAGLDRPFYLSQLKFEVKQGDNGYYILVSTDKALKEPFLNFLLDVRWPQGDLQREYTVLLNPPQYSAGKPSGPVQSGVATAAAQVWPHGGTAPVSSHSSMEVPVAGERRDDGTGRSTRYGPVQANQTLWGIANEVRPSDGVTVYQVMQAILLSNPGAFIDGDINAIMKGSVLRVPPRAEIARIDANEATRQIQAQLTRWQKQHSSSGASEVPSARGSIQVAALGRDQAGAAEATAASTPPAKSGLHIMAAQTGAGMQATVSLADQGLAPTQQNILRLQQQLALLEEHNASLTSANARLQQQTSSLQKELIDLKDTADLPLDADDRLFVTEPLSTTQLGTTVSPQDETNGDPSVADSSEMPSASQWEATNSGHVAQGDVKNAAVSTEAAQPAPVTALNTAAEAAAAAGPSEPHGVQEAPAVAAAAPQAKPAAQEQATLSLKARFLAYLIQAAKPLALLVSGLLVALLLLWAVRRRRGATALPRALMPAALAPIMGQAFAAIKPGKAALNLAYADVQSQTGTAVRESTPLDEAEAYIACGRYDQAQERLDRALGEYPDSQELRLKLLEVLAAQGDRSGFEAEAQVLHTQVTDETDSHWQRAIQLARHIAPDHPLFSNAPTLDTETAAMHSKEGTDTAAAESETVSMPQAMAAEVDLGSEALALDLSASLGKEDLRPAGGHEQNTVLEFDLGEIETFVSQHAKENRAPGLSQDAADEDDPGLLDFSLPEDWAASLEAKEGGAEEGRTGGGDERDVLQFVDFSLQNEVDGPEGMAETATDEAVDLDEVGTKLDLARAYLDMGDAAGARSLLSEVVTEGNAAQQSEAQDLLCQVG